VISARTPKKIHWGKSILGSTIAGHQQSAEPVTIRMSKSLSLLMQASFHENALDRLPVVNEIFRAW